MDTTFDIPAREEKRGSESGEAPGFLQISDFVNIIDQEGLRLRKGL